MQDELPSYAVSQQIYQRIWGTYSLSPSSDPLVCLRQAGSLRAISTNNFAMACTSCSRSFSVAFLAFVLCTIVVGIMQISCFTAARRFRIALESYTDSSMTSHRVGTTHYAGNSAMDVAFLKGGSL